MMGKIYQDDVDDEFFKLIISLFSELGCNKQKSDENRAYKYEGLYVPAEKYEVLGEKGFLEVEKGLLEHNWYMKFVPLTNWSQTCPTCNQTIQTTTEYKITHKKVSDIEKDLMKEYRGFEWGVHVWTSLLDDKTYIDLKYDDELLPSDIEFHREKLKKIGMKLVAWKVATGRSGDICDFDPPECLVLHVEYEKESMT